LPKHNAGNNDKDEDNDMLKSRGQNNNEQQCSLQHSILNSFEQTSPAKTYLASNR